MGKKNRHHSVHLSEEDEATARESMVTVGAKTLNAYFRLVIRDHALFLRVCALAGRMADNWREVLKLQKEERRQK